YDKDVERLETALASQMREFDPSGYGWYAILVPTSLWAGVITGIWLAGLFGYLFMVASEAFGTRRRPWYRPQSSPNVLVIVVVTWLLSTNTIGTWERFVPSVMMLSLAAFGFGMIVLPVSSIQARVAESLGINLWNPGGLAGSSRSLSG